MYKKEKLQNIKIIQISSAGSTYGSYGNMSGEMKVFGLGEDGLVYIWNKFKGKWFLNYWESEND